MKNNNMLGKLVGLIVTVPDEMLGALCDLAEKIASKEGASGLRNWHVSCAKSRVGIVQSLRSRFTSSVFLKRKQLSLAQPTAPIHSLRVVSSQVESMVRRCRAEVNRPRRQTQLFTNCWKTELFPNSSGVSVNIVLAGKKAKSRSSAAIIATSYAPTVMPPSLNLKEASSPTSASTTLVSSRSTSTRSGLTTSGMPRIGIVWCLCNSNFVPVAKSTTVFNRKTAWETVLFSYTLTLYL